MSETDPPVSFVDTNILVYAAALDDPVRGKRAQELLDWLMGGKAFCTSTQVLQEFYTTAMRKGKPSFDRDEALEYLDDYAAHPLFQVDYPAIRESAEVADAHRISFWDALIVVAARRSGARRLYTEHLQHGQVILGVEVVNPFRTA